MATTSATAGLPATTTTLVLMGVSGSGKSTVMAALEVRLDWATAEGDDFHSPAEVAKMRSGHPLDDADRRPWLAALARWIGEREAAGEDALVTCSALKRAYRDVLRRHHPSVRFVHLTAPESVLAERVAQRTGSFMPAALLPSQEATLEPLAPDEPGIVVSVVPSATTVADEIVARLHLVTRSDPGR